MLFYSYLAVFINYVGDGVTRLLMAIFPRSSLGTILLIDALFEIHIQINNLGLKELGYP